VEGYHQVGIYAGRTLKGENPGDLPIMQPTKFTLAIKPQAREGAGHHRAPTLFTLADDVIE
jgi:putative ABC transport system substrate-binding protein